MTTDDLLIGKMNTTANGYKHPDYAKSLSDFGNPYELPRSKGWILKRRIPGFPYYDGMGCYPIFACEDWSQLYEDLDDLADDLISISVVTDPFGEYEKAYLSQCFKNIVLPFKEHFTIELCRPLNTFVNSHHRRYANKALRNLCIERCEDPLRFLDEWVNLYTTLIKRHNINGISTFSRLCFAQQLSLPGTVVFRALYEETTVGMLLWYVQGKVSYYHLGAYSILGYELRASFGLFWSAIEYFAASGLHWISLGAGAGVKDNRTDGLSRFKHGWSTGTRTAYFCGRIFNQVRYAEITQTKGISANDYFPAYRKGEFI